MKRAQFCCGLLLAKGQPRDRSAAWGGCQLMCKVELNHGELQKGVTSLPSLAGSAESASRVSSGLLGVLGTLGTSSTSLPKTLHIPQGDSCTLCLLQAAQGCSSGHLPLFPGCLASNSASEIHSVCRACVSHFDHKELGCFPKTKLLLEERNGASRTHISRDSPRISSLKNPAVLSVFLT